MLYFDVRSCRYVGVAIVWAWLTALGAQPGSEMSSIADRLKPNVVSIRAYTSGGVLAEKGFGFITGIREGRLFVVTAAHVVRPDGVRNAARVEVQFFGEVDRFTAVYKRHWDIEDLALLEVNPAPDWLRWQADCADFNAREGQTIRFIGRYFDDDPRWVSPGSGELYHIANHQLNFAINTVLPGVSGAPLLGAGGILGLITHDDQATATALSLARIRELLIDGGQFPHYFTLRATGSSESASPPAVTAPALSVDMACIAGGTFTMGCTSEQQNCDSDEKPTTSVTVSSFYLAKNELTVGEFARFVETERYQTDAEKGDGSYIYGPSGYTKQAGINWRHDATGALRPASEYNHPVIHVSWNDAVAYCNWLSRQDGLTPCYTITGSAVTCNWSANGYRLPTEAEWEYAARSGGKAYLYAWGNRAPNGNVADESGKRVFSRWTIFEGYDDGYVYTAPVGRFKQGDLGLYDMSGNVWEWCWDWKGSYPGGSITNPRGPGEGVSRVYRGGSWANYPQDCRVARRGGLEPPLRCNYVGFRLARS